MKVLLITALFLFQHWTAFGQDTASLEKIEVAIQAAKRALVSTDTIEIDLKKGLTSDALAPLGFVLGIVNAEAQLRDVQLALISNLAAVPSPQGKTRTLWKQVIDLHVETLKLSEDLNRVRAKISRLRDEPQPPGSTALAELNLSREVIERDFLRTRALLLNQAYRLSSQYDEAEPAAVRKLMETFKVVEDRIRSLQSARTRVESPYPGEGSIRRKTTPRGPIDLENKALPSKTH